MNKIVFLWISIVLLAGAVFLGCETNTAPSADQPLAHVRKTLDGDDIILARVNQSPISKWDLDNAISSAFVDPLPEHMPKETVQNQMLAGLVASRAISQAWELEMNGEETARLDKEVAAFREKCLVRQYVLHHSPPEPVSHRAMYDYYTSHIREFGGDAVRTYELITAQHRLKAAEQDPCMHQMKQAPEYGDWKKWTAQMKGSGYPLAYRQGVSGQAKLHDDLQKVIDGLHKGERSDLLFIKEMPYVVRVIDIIERPPQPFEAVKDTIRNRLTADHLRQSVSRVSHRILKQAQVVYENAPIIQKPKRQGSER